MGTQFDCLLNSEATALDPFIIDEVEALPVAVEIRHPGRPKQSQEVDDIIVAVWIDEVGPQPWKGAVIKVTRKK